MSSNGCICDTRCVMRALPALNGVTHAIATSPPAPFIMPQRRRDAAGQPSCCLCAQGTSDAAPHPSPIRGNRRTNSRESQAGRRPRRDAAMPRRLRAPHGYWTALFTRASQRPRPFPGAAAAIILNCHHHQSRMHLANAARGSNTSKAISAVYPVPKRLFSVAVNFP